MKVENCLAYALMKEHDSDLYGYAPAYDGAGTEELVYALDAYKSYCVYEHGAGEKDFADYCRKLEREGYVRDSAKTANGNAFAAYTNGDSIVNVSYIRYRDVDKYVVQDISYVAIAVDSVRNSTLPDRCGEYEAITTVQVSMVNILTLVVRLADGRFLVIDSGLHRDADRVYDTLCQQNVRGGKPVIAAWLFSHAHSDHVGGFIGILEKYGDAVEVQRVVHHFPGEATYMGKNYMEGIPNREGENMTARSNDIHRLMREKMPEGRFAIAHAGQTFAYPGVQIEVLMTTENIVQKQMFDTNMSSVVYLLTMPNGKLLALGDAVDAEAKILRKIYGETLKCDAVVLAHHAYNGGDEELYHNTGATAAIWPNYTETLVSRGLIGHFTNHFDYNRVKYNFMMSQNGPVMTLYHGMPADEIAHFTPKFDVKHADAVCYACRRNPQHYLTADQLREGYGNAPRYYGKGEETETLVMNPEDKTYVLTISGAAEEDFAYYCNSLKRDGYVRMSDSQEEGRLCAVYADPLNEVGVSYLDGVITITVGRAGRNVLQY